MPEESEDVLRRLAAVGDSIRILRTAKGMAVRTLSEKSGVGVTTIKDLEKHDKVWTPRKATLVELSRALGLDETRLGDIYEEPELAIRRAEPARTAEDYLAEISGWMQSVDRRLDRIDTALGLAPRPDIIHPEDD